MVRTRLLLSSLLLCGAAQGASAQVDSIQLNQVGFYPDQPKVAVIRGPGSVPFSVVSASTQDTVLNGLLTSGQTWPHSGQSVSRAEFSSVTAPGRYILQVPGIGSSHPFDISPRVHQRVAIGALKAFYFQRASISLPAQHAQQWAREAGHPDTAVIIHASAASGSRPEGSTIASPQGWYDAGDYNKYVVNAGISTFTLLATYEHFSDYSSELRTNIPESDNAIPDVLDEALWSVRWLLTMQDPGDGGVYAKLTNQVFDFSIMPFQATAPRYVVMKTTGATLDFAAVMAQASRIFAPYTALLPGLADSCLQASLAAWNWARMHPNIVYDQDQMNQLYDPDIFTGDYSDTDFGDEFDWAAAELFVTTGRDSFLTAANPLDDPTATVPNWQHVRTLALYTLAHHRSTIAASVDTLVLRNRLIGLAEALGASRASSAYDVAMGVDASDFVWGSNGVAANQGMALIMGYRLTGNNAYLEAALSNLDYLLGRNGTSYCFVTGFGTKSPLHIHHRPSQADGIALPVPGLIAGGPNPGQQDGHPYPSNMPGLSYTDNYQAYASNEVAINWNAPLLYLAAGLEALLSPNGLPTAIQQDERRSLPMDPLMLRNYPNPFNPQTTIEYRIPRSGYTTVEVFDMLGRKVQELQNGWLDAGYHSVEFDASGLPSGVYLCRLGSLDGIRVLKLTVTR